MEMLYNALLGELVGRSISFLVSKYGSQPATAAAAVREEHLQRLRLLLLRSGTILEEADGRHVANRGALRRQLEALRDEMFRGHYVLDTFRYQAGRRPAGRHDAKEATSRRRVFGSSVSNPAKRVRRLRLSPDDDDPELQRVVLNLETIVGDTKELVMFLMRCPPLHRQPYSAHLSLDKCMFGRHAERDRVIEFLLQPDPPDAANPGVLPIIGPALIGKSTLVEHVCNDERVRNCFSLILFYTRNELEYETITSFMDNCVIKHRRNNASNDERWLIVIEVSGDVDDRTWKRLHSAGRWHMAKGSKLIVTSRSEKIARFGTTTQPLRLKCLTTEAFWYFFKLLVFGSTDPEEHPKLASMAMEMAVEMRGSFMGAGICATILRTNFSAQFWYMNLTRLRWYMQKNLALFGEYPDDLKATDQPRRTWSIIRPVPDECFLFYEMYQRGTVREDALPEVTMVDLMTGRAEQRGKFEILYWKSTVPPYFSYICPCEISNM
ncbi:hypothetical protein ACP70R_042193 [Stipagrostis hirtigluma subsp. patula]